jgi:N-acetylglutamate synthase-like GNAT family acetyltransferase
LQVRRAAPGDADAVAAVFTPSFESLTFLPRLHTHDEHRAYVRRLVTDTEVWVAEDEGRVVGFAALQPDMLSQLSSSVPRSAARRDSRSGSSSRTTGRAVSTRAAAAGFSN